MSIGECVGARTHLSPPHPRDNMSQVLDGTCIRDNRSQIEWHLDDPIPWGEGGKRERTTLDACGHEYQNHSLLQRTVCSLCHVSAVKLRRVMFYSCNKTTNWSNNL